jgi:predicted nucleic acid-binding protein
MARVSYLLDTHIVSEPLARKPNPGLLEGIRLHSRELAIATITWQELLYGMLLLPEGKRRHQIEDYLLHRVRPIVPILGFDAAAARWQAERWIETGVVLPDRSGERENRAGFLNPRVDFCVEWGAILSDFNDMQNRFRF